MRSNLIILALTIVSTWLLIDGYRDGTMAGLAQMGIGAVVACLVLRLVSNVDQLPEPVFFGADGFGSEFA